jgi:hypothetical protein
MIKTLLIILVFIFVAGILINAIMQIMVNNIKKLEKENEEEKDKKYIKFYLLGDNYATYQAFCQYTLDLKGLRDISKKVELSEEDKNKLLESIDASLMDLQTLMYDSQTNIPDPTVLTKSYMQSMMIKMLELRVLYESLIGNSIVEEYQNDCNKETEILTLAKENEE